VKKTKKKTTSKLKKEIWGSVACEIDPEDYEEDEE